MSEYMFGVTRRKPTRDHAKIIERIAEAHGATWIEAELPGTGYQAWFAGPNRGEPFDRRLSAAVLADIAATGVIYGDAAEAVHWEWRPGRTACGLTKIANLSTVTPDASTLEAFLRRADACNSCKRCV